ncbi:MAG: 5-formyltetrahydrofolate cyclo-ligase [Calditrichaeota bacterium]|nr:5-formyltetrahydrofolate cyclo-ligase [Calditrichota bacterium]
MRFSSKSRARQYVWDLLVEQRVARFPLPPHGRIPNFKGAEAAARRLFDLPLFQHVKRLKVNPDAPQRYVRQLALEKGIVVYMPTPRLRGGFFKLDPAQIPPSKYAEAAQLSRCQRWAIPVPLKDMPPVDAIVTGSVAVTREGKRCGKGEGYGDLEYAILRELGYPEVPVVTTVHPLQIVDDFPRDENDLPLHWIVTPHEIIPVEHPFPAPRGIDWDRLPADALKTMPILQELYQSKYASGKN